MIDHEIILKMIEEVSPDDTKTLDDIDIRTFLFLTKHLAPHPKFWDEDDNKNVECIKKLEMKVPKYTRSRDALKSIRPEGWTWVANTQDEGCHFNYYSPNPNHMRRLSRVMPSEYFPTEELAELHAIIQAIAYERGQS